MDNVKFNQELFKKYLKDGKMVKEVSKIEDELKMSAEECKVRLRGVVIK